MENEEKRIQIEEDGREGRAKDGAKTLLEVFASHIDEGHRKPESYEHPGNGLMTSAKVREIADEVARRLADGTLRTDDLHMRINYSKPGSKSGNAKLRGVVYMASHPLIDCYLDGLERKVPACDGLNSWCYAFKGIYNNYGKQLSMFANSALYIAEPERAEREIMEWIDANSAKLVPSPEKGPGKGRVAFRIDEAGDLTYCLPIWLRVAKAHPEMDFYAYTKQFAMLNGLDYCVNKAYPNFRILLSDSVVGDPNPADAVREDYGRFAILFKDASLTPDYVIALSRLADFGKRRCPGAKAGCYGCAKCSSPETPTTKTIVADEH